MRKEEVLPLTYNFYPELLETLPWGSGQQAAGLKAVHLHSRWHPLASVGDSRITKFFQEEAVRQYPLVEEWSPRTLELLIGSLSFYPTRQAHGARLRTPMILLGKNEDIANQYLQTTCILYHTIRRKCFPYSPPLLLLFLEGRT